MGKWEKEVCVGLVVQWEGEYDIWLYKGFLS